MQEFIKLNKVIINNDQVSFTSDHTCYANEFRVKSFNVTHLLKRFTALTKLLKENGTSISHKYKTRKFIADNIKEYDQAVQDYNHHFECMQKLAVKITSQPLPVGTIDNKDLNAMYGHRNLAIKMLNRSSIISKVLEFEERVTSLYQDLTVNDCNYSKVTF
tara:strand:+ start:70 stop:552 length:483 start_codon:yes stop_codon:yes gene_type:complete